MEISISTLIYFFALAFLIITLFFLTYIRIYKAKDPNLKVLVCSMILLIIACPLFAMRGRIPDIFSFVFAYLFFILGSSYSVYCIAFADKLFSRKRFLRISIIPFILFTLFLPFISYSGKINGKF